MDIKHRAWLAQLIATCDQGEVELATADAASPELVRDLRELRERLLRELAAAGHA